MASSKLPCSLPGLDGRALCKPIIFVTAIFAYVDSSHAFLLLSASTLVFCRELHKRADPRSRHTQRIRIVRRDHKPNESLRDIGRDLNSRLSALVSSLSSGWRERSIEFRLPTQHDGRNSRN
jgi:hypothetical protein